MSGVACITKASVEAKQLSLVTEAESCLRKHTVPTMRSVLHLSVSRGDGAKH